ncbi:MAG: substrate-binding domain-containing protein, partial [Lentisphaeria bacterium]|nr:substrate-binding domain-containing protein [Lentisphaeria bacterium]
ELYATNTGSTPSTIEAVKSLLDRGATALVTVNEGLELETLHALNVLGVRVPDEVALLSWTQPNPAGFVRPSISGIEQNFEELVRQSCETFRRLLAGEPAGDTLIDYRLQIRESSAKSVAAKGGGRK